MALQFTNPLVAMVYQATVEQDRMVHVGCYSGLLSAVDECAAERMIGRGSNLIELLPARMDVQAAGDDFSGSTATPQPSADKPKGHRNQH